MLRRLLRENIRVSLETTDPLHHVKADVSQIEQVILNLVVNASDAMPEGGSLSVATRNVTLDAAYARERVNVTPGEYTMLVVTDTGVGMSPATMARMFEPFFTTKPIGKGTGLGLATTYAIVQRFGGHIEAQSHVGVGTAFRIYLPRYVDEASEGETESCPPEGNVAGTETVLLVEDEDPVRIAMKRSLERLGYTVLEASNGETGLSALAERGEDIDVVVTDVMMPGMTGRAMADQLLTTRPEMPVVFISGYADDVTRERGLVDETHAFMQKPFTGLQLARTIREMLHERARAA
jgi:two-component system cell cycle sensor histidine kinase/response regulator CckA